MPGSRVTAFFRFLPVLALASAAAAAPADKSFYELVATERAFAQRAQDRGATAAFQEYLADDSVVFAPAPMNGREFYAGRERASNALLWGPAQAEIAASGDLGYTMGPWLARPLDAPDADPKGAGHFFSVWRRGDDGKFRNVIDVGVDHAPQALPAAVDRRGPQATVAATALSASQRSARQNALLLADRELVARLADGDGAPALAAVLTDDAIVLRNGSGPRWGARSLPEPGTLPPMDLVALHVSAAGDFGATAGAGGDPKRPHVYVRAWRWTDAGWRICADALKH
jgi:ketosteroid isomerase-like protein